MIDFDVQESFRSGKTGPIRVIVRGSIRPGAPTTSITPSSEDLREGRRLLLFLANREFESPRLDASVPWRLYSFAEVYRIEDRKAG